MISSLSSNNRATSLPPSNIINENALRRGVLGLCQPSDRQHLHMINSPPESKLCGSDPCEKHPNRQPYLTELNYATAVTTTTSSSTVNTAETATQDHLSEPQYSTIVPCEFTANADDDSGYGHTPPNYNRQAVAGSNSSIVTNSTPISLDTLSIGYAYSFDSKDELLQVMTEDLFDWFIHMYPQLTKDLEVETFFDRLADGVLLGHHAGELHRKLAAQSSMGKPGGQLQSVRLRVGGLRVTVPSLPPNYQTRGLGGSSATSGFIARDNVANFITWCRQLGMPDSVLFESEDLVCRKNVRNVAICLLELARLGGHLGMLVPDLVQLEVEIDREIAAQSDLGVDCTQQEEAVSYLEPGEESLTSSCSLTDAQSQSIDDDVTFEDKPAGLELPVDRLGSEDQARKEGSAGGYRINKSTRLRYSLNKQRADPGSRDANQKTSEGLAKPKHAIQRPVVDMRSLDEIVRDLLSQCTCKQTFPMVRVGEGRYLFGDKSTQIFVRILRRHVMVRVGGGWDTLSHFLGKYDECRKNQLVNQTPLVTEYKTTPLVSCQKKQIVQDGSIDMKHADSCVRDMLEETCPIDQSSPIKGELRLTAVKKRSLPTCSYHSNVDDLESFDPRSLTRNIFSVNDVNSVERDPSWARPPGGCLEPASQTSVGYSTGDSVGSTGSHNIETSNENGLRTRAEPAEKPRNEPSRPGQLTISRPIHGLSRESGACSLPRLKGKKKTDSATASEYVHEPPKPDELSPLPSHDVTSLWQKQSPIGMCRTRRPSAPQISLRSSIANSPNKSSRGTPKPSDLQKTPASFKSAPTSRQAHGNQTGQSRTRQVNTPTSGLQSTVEGCGEEKMRLARTNRLPSLIPVPVRTRSLSRNPIAMVKRTC